MTTTVAGGVSSCSETPSRCTWQQASTGLSFTPNQGNVIWNSARQHCSQLQYNGQYGWRLPTDSELLNAYNNGTDGLNSITMPNTSWKDEHWTSNWGHYMGTIRATTVKQIDGSKWTENIHYPGEHFFCVKSSSPIANQYWRDATTIADGSATTCGETTSRCSFAQRSTGLSFTPDRGELDWNAANETCRQMNYNGTSGWRLPTTAELAAARGNGSDGIQEIVMPRTNWHDFFWTSTMTSSEYGAMKPLVANLMVDTMVSFPINFTFHVVCVRQ